MVRVNRLFALILPALLAALALPGGCSTPVRQEYAAEQCATEGCTVEAEVPAQRTPRQRLLYDTLVAEIAGHLGNLPESVAHYRKILDSTTELSVIRRAIRIMLFSKDYDAADQAIQRWLQLDPDSIEAHQLAATVSLRRGDIAAAEKNLQWMLRQADTLEQGFRLVAAFLDLLQDKQLALNIISSLSADHPDSVYAREVLARLAFNAGEFERAHEVAQKIVATRPDNFEAQTILAHSTLEMGRTDEALSLLQAIVVKHPQDSPLRLAYARMLVTTNHHQRALEQFEVLLEKAPGDADLIYSAALLAMQIRRYDQAEKYFHTLLSKGSHRQPTWFYLGRLHEQRKEYEDALSWFERVDAPELYLDAQMRAAGVQGKLGQLDKARQRFSILRQGQAGEKSAIWLSEGEMLREIGEHQTAFDVLSDAVQELPEDTDLRYSRALAAERIGRLDLLESDLQRVLQQEPEHAHALNALGYTLADRTTRYQEALDYITRALQLVPHDPAIIDSMGWVQYRLGNLDKALHYLRKASENLQDDEVAAHLGEVLWVKGDREAAAEVWRDGLREHPDSEILQRVIERFKP